MPKMSVLSFALLGTYGKLRLSLLLLGLLNMIYIYKEPLVQVFPLDMNSRARAPCLIRYH